MNTLEELAYYCNETEPVGALLLAGEWGCGKTYLVENELREKVKETAVVLRISLFGIASPEDIHAAVKGAWFEQFCTLKGYDAVADKIDQGKKILSKLDFLPDWLKGVGSTDIASFVPITNQMEEKSVILVFDDLERCRMSSVDVLGIINDYCENQKFHTIIVANQEKMKEKHEPTKITGEIQHFSCDGKHHEAPSHTSKLSISVPQIENEGDLAFSEIKEKIIQRTVRYLPNYPAIVHAVISNLKYDDEEYKTFVSTCEKGLLNLFAPDQEADADTNNSVNAPANKVPVIPHNIRSFKCAIRDFYRVYCLLKENEISNIEKWFYSFASYLLASKADLLSDQSYGGLFSDDVLRYCYPAYDEKYMFAASKKWIQHGIWDQNHFNKEVDWLKTKDVAQLPVEILKAYHISDVDEEIIVSGFGELMAEAYEGNLTLDEYVLLIQNCAWARENKYEFPIMIEWKKVSRGVSMQIDKLKKDLPQGQILYRAIDESQKKYFLAEEWNIYTHISSFARGDELTYHKNKLQYIELVQELGSSAFMHLQNKCLKSFDSEMAIATATAYEKENTEGKNEFVGFFTKMWNRNISSFEIQVEESITGFSALASRLQCLLARCSTAKRTFAAIHTERFLREVNLLLEKLSPKPVDSSGRETPSNDSNKTTDAATDPAGNVSQSDSIPPKDEKSEN